MVAPKLMSSMATIMYAPMDRINVLLSDLVAQEKLSYHESQNFLDFAYDLVLDGYSDLEIENIIIEDKSNPEKNLSHEFKPSEIFKASDLMVDSLTQLLARERAKKESN